MNMNWITLYGEYDNAKTDDINPCKQMIDYCDVERSEHSQFTSND